MPDMDHVWEEFKASSSQAFIKTGKRESVKVIIAGAPVNRDFADRIGPDGYAPNAAAAADLAKN
jgi:5-methyltetrahydrofolate--homocysteine methyltransferase